MVQLLFLLLGYATVLRADISAGKLSMDFRLGKIHCYCATNSLQYSPEGKTDSRIALFAQQISETEKAFGIGTFDAYGDKSNDLIDHLGSIGGPGLISYLFEDSRLVRGDLSHDHLIKKVKEYFVAYNKKLKNDIGKSGACALVVLYLPEKIVVAHVGSGRAVSSDHRSIMTHDHKPFLPHEVDRIKKSGDIVKKGQDERYRVDVSRAFGSLGIAGITAEPDVSIFDYNLKLLATSSGTLEKEFWPISVLMKKEGLPIYSAKPLKSKSGHHFIILANTHFWNNFPHDISDYSSYDFALCGAGADENGRDTRAGKVASRYHCARLGTAEIATHIVESVLKTHGLNQEALERATTLLQVASVQKEQFNLGFFEDQSVLKKSIFRKVKEFFIRPRTRAEIILSDMSKIRESQSVAIIAWDYQGNVINKHKGKLKSRLSVRKNTKQ